jgi:hypothetical protein
MQSLNHADLKDAVICENYWEIHADDFLPFLQGIRVNSGMFFHHNET